MTDKTAGIPPHDTLDRIVWALRSCKEAGRRGQPLAAADYISLALRTAESAIEDRDRAFKREDRRLLAEDAGVATATPKAIRTLRKAEQYRRRIFELARPEILLHPANIVTVYLATNPMWPSWSWEDTKAINTLMLAFVQKLDPGDPLPDQPELALSMTAAGFAVYRALHATPAPESELRAEVYREIIDGIVLIDRLFSDAAARKIRGEVSEEFLTDFAHVVETAGFLLLHANRLGLDAWTQTPPLILRCVLRERCKRQEPFYVNPPGGLRGGRDPHAACRKTHDRAETKGAATVTTIRPKRNI